ncbi:MAG: A/G-specific adenine glycosylase [Saprospiraceae bacterium]|nr:A/G-specific adenine glycosylase [Saprospiraceae bacterium]HMW38159.1 A/G-specific adenine glycosylase [Saprospiraceae bacterium]HMX87710.1 A/G-specific adenine glycosylase [Saprospiraceae bacterium]HMZ39525.1 A/G-specific adenine glycosylase [Saprospiraceae bacterium]HNA63102.1 A/G-specific adenine glycosylase [Saprospiraceae bacterium]
MKKTRFRQAGAQLVTWVQDNERQLPWKSERDPYKIWVSEIMLQQTRAEQVTGYYKRFLARFPTISALASANETDVLRMWEGLGYYSRARNLHKAAIQIIRNYNGVFPSDYDKIRALPGIGDYTAAAISAFAFGASMAAVDGNAIRILSRYFGILDYPDTALLKKKYLEYAQNCLGDSDPALFNQGMMDLGATICIPRLPLCDQCPISEGCYARRMKITSNLPPPRKRNTIKERVLQYVVIADEFGNTLIRRREGKDIWCGLFEFVLEETKEEAPLSSQKIRSILTKTGVMYPLKVLSVREYKHILTHQRVLVKFYHVKLKGRLKEKNYCGYQAESVKNLLNFAFPRITRVYLSHEII